MIKEKGDAHHGKRTPRALGVCGFAVEAKAVETSVEKTFDANLGVWRDGDEAAKDVSER